MRWIGYVLHCNLAAKHTFAKNKWRTNTHTHTFTCTIKRLIAKSHKFSLLSDAKLYLATLSIVTSRLTWRRPRCEAAVDTNQASVAFQSASWAIFWRWKKKTKKITPPKLFGSEIKYQLEKFKQNSFDEKSTVCIVYRRENHGIHVLKCIHPLAYNYKWHLNISSSLFRGSIRPI